VVLDARSDRFDELWVLVHSDRLKAPRWVHHTFVKAMTATDTTAAVSFDSGGAYYTQGRCAPWKANCIPPTRDTASGFDEVRCFLCRGFISFRPSSSSGSYLPPHRNSNLLTVISERKPAWFSSRSPHFV
jgi:hypothetical protein